MLRVALLQMVSHGLDQEANLRKGIEFCRRARSQGADLALFPEMWNIGYTFFWEDSPEARETWSSLAVSVESEYVLQFRSLARELEMAIGLTYLERWPGAPRNTISLIDRRGEVRLTYAKVHTCEFSLEAALTPGNQFPVCTLQTAAGEVKVGAMICDDREFPESARILMLNGAEIILTPNACTLDEHRRAQFQTRAFENMVGVAMATYAAPQENGHSIACDGMAYTLPPGDQDGETRNMKLIEAGEEEGIHPAEFDLERLRAYRQRETWCNAFRRPRLYGALVSEAVQPPLVRPKVRR